LKNSSPLEHYLLIADNMGGTMQPGILIDMILSGRKGYLGKIP
jgi:hypothetical protein